MSTLGDVIDVIALIGFLIVMYYVYTHYFGIMLDSRRRSRRERSRALYRLAAIAGAATLGIVLLGLLQGRI
jgi:hypothetical protein